MSVERTILPPARPTARTAADRGAARSGRPATGPAPDHQSHWRGHLALGLSVVCIGLAMNFTHEATRSLPVLWVVALLCVAGPPAGLLIGWVSRMFGLRGGLASVTPRSQLKQFGKHPVALALAAATGALGAGLQTYVIYRNGASTAAFLTNLIILFSALGGVLLGERLSGIAIPAMAVMIAGAFIYSLTKDVALAGPALLLMSISTLASTAKQMIVARTAEKHELASFVEAKQICIAGLLITVALLGSKRPLSLNRGIAFVCTAGVLKNAVGMTLLYVGIQSVGLMRAGASAALRPLVVLPVAVALGESMPGPIQLAGALMIVVGAIVLCTRGRPRNPAGAPRLPVEDAITNEPISLQQRAT